MQDFVNYGKNYSSPRERYLLWEEKEKMSKKWEMGEMDSGRGRRNPGGEGGIDRKRMDKEKRTPRQTTCLTRRLWLGAIQALPIRDSTAHLCGWPARSAGLGVVCGLRRPVPPPTALPPRAEQARSSALKITTLYRLIGPWTSASLPSIGRRKS